MKGKFSLALLILSFCALHTHGMRPLAPWLGLTAGPGGNSRDTLYTCSIDLEAGVSKTCWIHPYNGGDGNYVPENNALQMFSSACVLPEGYHPGQGPEAVRAFLRAPASKRSILFSANIQNNPFATPKSPVTVPMCLPAGVATARRSAKPALVPDAYTMRELRPQYLMEAQGTERHERMECWARVVNIRGTATKTQHFPPTNVILHARGNASSDSHRLMGVNSAEEPFLVFWRVDRFVSGRQSVYGVTLLLGNQECDALRAVFPSMNFQDMDFATIWTACIDTSRFRGTRAAAHLFSVLGFS